MKRLIASLLALFLLSTDVSYAAAAHVQTTTWSTNSGASITKAVTWTSGSLGIVYLFTFTPVTTVTISSVTDNLGNTFTLTKDNTLIANRIIAIYQCPNLIGGSATVTASFSGAGNTNYIAVAEYSGIATTSPNEVAHAIDGTSATPSITVTPTTDGSVYIGFITHLGLDGTTITAGSGENQRAIHTGVFPNIQVEDQVGSTGAQSIDWTLSVSSYYLEVDVSYKPASASTVKKVAGVSQASVKKILGVTTANTKKIIGVTNV